MEASANLGPEVRIAELREAATRLLSHMEDQLGQTVQLEHEYFWDVPRETAYSISTGHGELTIGQLSESLENLRAMVMGPEDDLLSYGLVWLADLLKAIGRQVIV